MKKIAFIAIALLLISTGASWGQEKLVLYDLDAFESAAGKVNQDDYKNMVKWAREVFQKYSEKKTVSFTKKDFDDIKKAKEDAEKNIEKLQKEKEKAEDQITSLNQDKQKLENEKNLQKRRADSLVSVVNARNKTIEDLQKSNASVADKDNTIKDLKDQISKQATTISNQDAALNKMKEDTIRMRNQLDKLAKSQGTIDDLTGQLAEKEKTINELNAQVSLLTGKKTELEGAIQAYRDAFTETARTINTIYNANINIQLVDMDEAKLSDAAKAWIGMKALIERTDEDLAKDLKGKVEKITRWESAVIPMKDAKAYMQGKYDNEKRKTWITKLKSLTLDGDKAKEREAMVTALEHQEKIKENYDIIVENLEKEQCFPDAETLKRVKESYLKTKDFVKNYYHPNCYNNYDEAIKMIEDELDHKNKSKKLEPSNKVDTPERFKKFISDLRGMF